MKDIRSNYDKTISIKNKDLVKVLDGSLTFGNVLDFKTGEVIGQCDMNIVRKTIRPGGHRKDGRGKAAGNYYVAEFTM